MGQRSWANFAAFPSRTEKRAFKLLRPAARAPFELTLLAGILMLSCGHKPAPKPPSFFPEANEVPGWVKSGETRTFPTDRLWEYIDGDADRYIQAGVQKTLTTDYHYKEKIEAAADIYVMSAPEGARKIFDSESSVGSEPFALGDAARLSKGSLTFRRGPYLVRLVAYQEDPSVGNALVELGRAIEKKLAGK